MKAIEVERRISEVDGKLAQLEPWLETLKAAWGEYLLQPEDDSRAQDLLRKIEYGWRRAEGVPPELVGAPTTVGLPVVEREIARLREKRQLLEAELPSDEELAQAEQQAEELLEQAERTSVRFNEAWSSYMEALKTAEAIARDVVGLRERGRQLAGQVQELAEQFALGVNAPREPQPDLGESKLAGARGALLRDVAHTRTITPILANELAAARRQVAGEEAA